MSPATLLVGARSVGPGHPCFVIAEAGVNHNGRLDLACELVDAAVAAGADAVKFQSFTAASLATPDAPRADYQQSTTGGTSQFEMLRELELSEDDHRSIQQHCAERGIQFLSTPFDLASARLLDGLGVPAFKIGSGELTNLELLAGICGLRRPMILSTGMADLRDVERAVLRLREQESTSIALLHCVSCYPAAAEDANLRAMHTLRTAFGVPVGFSDHTIGIEVSLAAVALGADIIEKHLTLDCTMAGPDHRSSMDPQAFGAFVRGIRTVESALGDGRKRPVAREEPIAAVARRSLVAACDVSAGDLVTEAVVATLRPGTGMAPWRRDEIIGRTARVPIARGTLFDPDMLA